ncbi:ThiJ/PfpI family protein [Bathymodiolus heckerae thiotrophic gill symbiont]|nr:ThiJ/PfpI family protein [Bathymodiolus heckerae thiotrophic gill symbiont]
MFDLPNNSDINNILRKFYKNNKIIAAVCHGPACFVGATLKNRQSLLAGRRITGFTNEEEIAAEQDKNMPFLYRRDLCINRDD